MGLARGPGVSRVPASGPRHVAVLPGARGPGSHRREGRAVHRAPPELPPAAFQDQRRLLSLLGFEGRGQAYGMCVQGAGVVWGELPRGDAEAHKKNPCSSAWGPAAVGWVGASYCPEALRRPSWGS